MIFYSVSIVMIHPVLQFFNSLDPRIQFTLEVENNRRINFFDMALIRMGHVVTCKWYQQPSSSGRYLNFLSVRPYTYKKNVAVNLVRRILGLTHVGFRKGVIRTGKKLLAENCYPPALINWVFSEVSNSMNNGTSPKLPRPAIDSSKYCPAICSTIV
ncbi:unnamed protein product [Bemisia tabaci]|uniref:Helix-turn-helix domain-containing protein n=1 Tax=Bemisia tabaci TaxID=7038 RepID=A0A9P0G3S7_BEMTA|nr:unnamed protein product [Bemisia tabaci]